MTAASKSTIKNDLVNLLKTQKEISKVIVFGSFTNSETPNDLDVAVFQDSDENYLDLALKYRKLTRRISEILPLDIFPIREGVSEGTFLEEIESGELIYER